MPNPKKNPSNQMGRLKREECKYTKHDSVFSQWEILIGPSDWENHSLGIEGIQRYRIHNLPLNSSCPGLYELGVAAIGTDLGREIRKKLDSDRVVVVYLGQADNVRVRLQHYGRAGSHLNSEKLSFGEGIDGKKGLGLFREIFVRGFPIVFRWCSMESKKLEEKTEAKLLSVFDYAWNKGGNGDRRVDDVYCRLEFVVSRNMMVRKKFHKWLEKYLLRKKKEGVKIISSSISPLLKEGKSVSGKVTVKVELDKEDNPVVCGLSFGDGTICTKSPIEGRKRCEAHKGKRNIGRLPNSVKHVRPTSFKEEPVSIESSMHIVESCGLHEGTMGGPSGSDEKFLPEELVTVCGVMLNDASICMNTPVEGRKRCTNHRGMRINGANANLSAEGNLRLCGVGLEGGDVCMEVPAHGRKHCEFHKGRRGTTSH